MSEYVSKYQQSLLDKGTFSITWELVPGRGAFEKDQEKVITSAAAAVKGGKVHALTLTDNPGGKPAVSAEMLGAEVAKLGIEPLVHLTCKDKGRNELESMLHGMERAGVRNILAMTGDYTYEGYRGRSKPVFDMDSSQLIGMISDMNKGLEIEGPKGMTRMAPSHFFHGCCVSPFKQTEGEQMTQYYKLKKKLAQGAQFVIPQLGFDARKFQEALLMVKLLGYGQVPVIGNVYILPKGAAGAMNRNAVPGCVVTKEMLAVLDEEAKDKATVKTKRLDRAAKMYAFMKGMGFAGVHIGGHGIAYEDVEYILGKGEEFAPNWMDFVREFDFPQPGGWYYFGEGPKTGLNTETPVDRSKRPGTPFSYRLFRLLHNSMFEPEGFLFKPSRWMAKGLDKSRGGTHFFTGMEHFAKGITNDCLHCGDCGLPDAAYVCVTSQCPKGQRNGPCGGSFEGWCEVFPGEKQCIYVRAYQRLKHYGKEEQLGAYQVPPCDYDLLWTSSWLNYFMGRDHTAKRIGIKPPETQKKEEPAKA